LNNRNAALGGLFKMMLSVVLSRLGSLITQVVAAWYLVPEQFGLYAATYSIAAIAMTIKNGSFISLMLHKTPFEQKELRDIAILVNLMLFFILFFTSLVQANDIASNLMMIFSCVLLFSIFGLDLRLKFSIEHDFVKLANLEVYSAVIQQAVSIFFLVIGFGVFSLAIGFFAVTLFEFIYKAKAIGFFNSSFTLPVSSISKYFSEFKWLIGSALVMGVALQGDYFALSLTTSFFILGIYFFAFQLTSAASQLITSSIRSVMVPTLIKYKNDISMLNKEYVFYSNLVFVWSLLFVFCGIVTSAFLIDLVWDGKWSLAIPVVNALLLSLVIRFQLPLLYSYFEVAEAWRFRFFILTMDAVFLLIIAFFSGLTSDLNIIALSIAAYRILSSLLFLLLAWKFINGFPFSVFLKSCVTTCCAVFLYAMYLLIESLHLAFSLRLIFSFTVLISSALFAKFAFKKECEYCSSQISKIFHKRFC
jgi:teichuronic acid exporter